MPDDKFLSRKELCYVRAWSRWTLHRYEVCGLPIVGGGIWYRHFCRWLELWQAKPLEERRAIMHQALERRRNERLLRRRAAGRVTRGPGSPLMEAADFRAD